MVPILHRFRCPAITTTAAAKVEVDSGEQIRAVMSVFDTLSHGWLVLVGTFYKEKVLVGAFSGHCENLVETFSERDVLSCGNMGNIRPAIR